MHKATLFIEIICHKLGGKGMIRTQPYGQNRDTAKLVAQKGDLIIYFCFAFAKTGYFPLVRTKGVAAQNSKAVTGDLANPLSGALRESCLFLPV